MAAFVRNTRRYNQQAYGKPANTLEYTIDRDSDGALGNQIYLLGHFDLEDEALVVDVRLGARYFIAPMRPLGDDQRHRRTGSLNLAQSLRNDDGTLTFVVSKHDPGVPNFDPSDLRQGILTLRWAEFEAVRLVRISGRRVGLVSLSDLRANLREETPVGRGARDPAGGTRPRRLPESLTA